VFLPIVATVFLTAFCLCIAAYLWTMERQASPKAELKRRLQQMARAGAGDMSEELRAEITRETRAADRLLARLPLTRDLDRKLDHAGLAMSVSRFVALVSGCAVIVASAVGLVTKSSLFAFLAAAVSLVIATVVLRLKTDQRKEKFTELFPDALAMISRSLRAGHSFTATIQLVGEEVPSPVGELFKTAYDQQLLGLRITDTLVNLNNRIESLDLRFFTTVIGINSEIGGNLSEVLDKLALTIRERLRIRRQVRVYTAQGRMSGYVVGVLPVIAFVAFNVLNPDYESILLKEPMGMYILAGAASLQLLGLVVIRNIINIKI